MSLIYVPTRFQWRKDTAANWTANNPTPLAGEPCLETDTGKWKSGDGVTAWNALKYQLYDAPSDGREYVRKDGAWAVAPGGGGGAMTLVGTATVAGSAATTLTLSSLDLGAYKSFVVDFSLDNATASAATIALYYNSDTTATNYYRQSVFNGGTTNSTSRGNDALVIALAASETATGSFKIIKDRDGKPRAWGQVNSAAPASIEQRVFSHAWTSATNVTGITLSSSVANSLAIGSVFYVYGIG